MVRLTLNGESFRKLVRGEEIGFDDLKIRLEDIGFGIMRHHIDEAERALDEARTSSDSPLSD